MTALIDQLTSVYRAFPEELCRSARLGVKTLSTALTYLPRQFCEYCFAWHFGFEGIALVHILLSNRSSVRIHVSIFSSIIVKSLFHALVDTPEECYPILEQMTRATSLAYLLVTSEEQMSNMPCRAG